MHDSTVAVTVTIESSPVAMKIMAVNKIMMNRLASMCSYVFTTPMMTWIITGIYQAVKGDSTIVITQTSPIDVTSGQIVCPSIHVEFTCIGVSISFLEWQINGRELQPNFDIGDSAPVEETSGSYTLYLDTISVNPVERVANMTSRFYANISSLSNEDRLSCVTHNGINSSTLDYVIRDPPPTPLGIDFSTKEVNEAFYLTWDSNFNSDYAITSYIIAPESTTKGSSMIICPRACYPDVCCQCTGLAKGDRVNITISAVNCGNQEGPATTITVASSCLERELGTVSNLTVSCDASSSSNGGSIVIVNGRGCFNGTTVGSVAVYQCDDGYSIVGDSQRYCLSNGSWTDNIPKCTARQTSIDIIVIVVPVIILSIIIILLLLCIAVTTAVCITKLRTRKHLHYVTLSMKK